MLADTSSRIARNQGDADDIRDRLNYCGARPFTLGDGKIDAFKGAIKGLLDEQQRKELAQNSKRAQKGRVAEGRSPAGHAYGYRTANRIDEGGSSSEVSGQSSRTRRRSCVASSGNMRVSKSKSRAGSTR